MSNTNSFQSDQYVQWDWGNGTAKGQIKERFEREVTRTLQGSEITRKGSEDDPAYLIKQDGEWRGFPDPSGREAAQQLAKQHAATYEKLEKWFKDRKVVLKKKLEK